MERMIPSDRAMKDMVSPVGGIVHCEEDELKKGPIRAEKLVRWEEPC